MKTVVGMMIMLLAVMSCDKGIDVTPASETFELYENSAIVKQEVEPGVFLHQRVEGSGLVAVYSYTDAQSDQVYDDEYGEQLSFELPTDKNQFVYSNEALTNLKVYFQQYGAWVSHGTVDVVSGTISGNQLDGEFSSVWRIGIDIEVEKDGKTYTINTLRTLVAPQ